MAVRKVIQRGSYWSGGPEIARLEKSIAFFVGRKYAVAFNSGTTAQTALIKAYGIRSGDEVIIPSFTYIATAQAVIAAGARPVWADIENHSYGLALTDIRRRVSPRTKAIMPMHYAGYPCSDSAAIADFARRRRLIMIEDAAQALGSSIGGKMAGSFGHAAIFSFCQDKIITAGEGGVAVTDTPAVCRRLLQIRQTDSYRMSALTAALLVSQLKRIKSHIRARQNVARLYDRRLAGIKSVRRFPSFFHDRVNHQKYPVFVGHSQRDRLQQFLSRKGITTRAYFSPLHRDPAVTKIIGRCSYSLPVTVKTAGEVLCLPIFPGMTPVQVKRVTNLIRQFGEKHDDKS